MKVGTERVAQPRPSAAAAAATLKVPKLNSAQFVSKASENSKSSLFLSEKARNMEVQKFAVEKFARIRESILTDRSARPLHGTL